MGMSRRRLLTVVTLVPLGTALGGCAFGAGEPDGPDPLIALAEAARADAALAVALVAAEPGLAERVDPLVAARTEHAAALDAEIARLDPETVPAAVPAPPPDPTLAALRAACEVSGAAAGSSALDLPAERVGLVASISACCTTYAAVLT